MWIWLIFQPANRSYNNWQPTARSCCLRGWSLPSPSASGDTAKALPIAGPSMEIKMACQVGSRFSPIGCCFGITKIGVFFWWENNDDKNVVFFFGGEGGKKSTWWLDAGSLGSDVPWPSMAQVSWWTVSDPVPWWPSKSLVQWSWNSWCRTAENWGTGGEEVRNSRLNDWSMLKPTNVLEHVWSKT